jgi:hypothetical protein
LRHDRDKDTHPQFVRERGNGKRTPGKSPTRRGEANKTRDKRKDKTSQDKRRLGKTRQENIKHGEARQDNKTDKTRQDKQDDKAGDKDKTTKQR